MRGRPSRRASSPEPRPERCGHQGPKPLEFHFDFGSPATYLAYTQVPRIAQETGATLAWHPLPLSGVFKATGNASPVSVPAKGRWMNDDIARWARRWGVPFAFNPRFPINMLTLMRGARGLLMRRPDHFRRYADAVFHAIWVALVAAASARPNAGRDAPTIA